jgi:hypothetical protein
MGTTFTNNHPSATGDVSAQEGCRVYSNLGPSGFPLVLDRSSGKLIAAWKLSEKAVGATPPRGAVKFDASPFSTESDDVFQNYVQVWPSYCQVKLRTLSLSYFKKPWVYTWIVNDDNHTTR